VFCDFYVVVCVCNVFLIVCLGGLTFVYVCVVQ